MPPVGYFIFDYVKQVLEKGEEFQRERYFAMLEQIQNPEFTKTIAGLVASMTRGIDGVSTQDLLAWFSWFRGEVPRSFQELSDSQGSGCSGKSVTSIAPPGQPDV